MCSPRLDELLDKLDDVLTSITTEILGIDPDTTLTDEPAPHLATVHHLGSASAVRTAR